MLKKSLIVFLLAFPTATFASPSKIVSIPSTDTQPALTLRGDAETYIRVSGERKASAGTAVSNESRDPGTTIVGLTIGLPAVLRVRSEIGVDMVAAGSDAAERNPATFHAKVVLPELALCEYSPAFAIGIYNYGPANEKTDQNIVYGLVAKTFPVVGRISAGGYQAGEHAVGPGGVESGALVSIDRPLGDKLWIGVDYMSGRNINSGVNAGISYAFSKRAALMAGYNLHTAREFSGTDTVVLRASFTFDPRE